MTLPFRRKLFYLFILIFILSGTIIVFYSQGYRFDFSSLSLVKTGAIYIQTTPKDINIILNSKKYKSSSSIVSSGTLITNLIPKKYHVEIQKDGYNTYEKNIKILPSEVERIFNIVLVPNKIPSKKVSEGIDGTIIKSTYETNKIITQDDNGIYYLCSTSQISNCINITSYAKTLVSEKILEIYFYPHENNAFIARTKNAIYRIDIENKSASFLEKGNFISTYIYGNNMYTTKKDVDEDTTVLGIYDLSLNKKIGGLQIPFPSDGISNISFTENGVAIILKNGKLFTYELSPIQKSNLVSDLVKNASFSPNGSKLLYQNTNGAIFVKMESDDISSLNLKKGAVIKLGIISSSEVTDIKWADEYHIILTYPNKMVFAEIDNRTPNNQYIIFKNNTKSALFLPEINGFYSIENNILNLYTIEP